MTPSLGSIGLRRRRFIDRSVGRGETGVEGWGGGEGRVAVGASVDSVYAEEHCDIV